MESLLILAEYQIALISTAVILGLVVGSFLNVVIYRLPVMMQREWSLQCQELLASENPESIDSASAAQYTAFNLVTPNSRCPHCENAIKPWHNIPVISFLLLGGKCAKCSTPISLRYPVIELVTGVLSGLVAYKFGATWLTLCVLVLTWSLITMTMIDFDHQLLPDSLTLPMLWLGLLVNTIDLGLGVTLQDAVIGAMAGYLFLWLFYWIFKLLTGKEGMGYGDFKLLAALGAWMGWQNLLPVIILSSLVGAVWGSAMILFMGRDKSIPMPFGPFLAGAGFIMLIWGTELYTLYNNMFYA